MNLGTTREEPDPPQETSSPARLRNIQQLQQSISEHTNPPTSEQIHQQVDRHQWIPEVETTRFIDAETNEPLRDLTPPLNDVNNRANNMFDMDIVVEPAGNVRPGNVLHPPVVIELKHRSGLDNADSRHHNYDHLWALASILSDQGTTALAPPRADLLLGTPVSSIHTAVQSESNTEIGYVSFSDLAIQQPGQYRLRVSLIRMEGLGGSTASSLQGGANLQSIVSRVIHVDEAAIAPSISK
ncbi:hypothetical protein MMC08_008032 [Hypocenomyce scalaris]|nr:hypothetical protein [Hypocenomyce scalaris]